MVVVRYLCIPTFFVSPGSLGLSCLLGNVVTVPWLLLGDFNQNLYPDEKQGGVPVVQSHMDAFQAVVESCALFDFPFSGPQFTWTNMRKRMANIQERLDRGLCNQWWLERFPDCSLTHLLRSRSDHCPVALHETRHQGLPPSRKVFRVQAAWFLHPEFEEFLGQCWADDCHQVLTSKLSFLSRSLDQSSNRLERLEDQLWVELDSTLAQVVVFWRQKYWVHWLKEGERNTKFFHRTTLIRR